MFHGPAAKMLATLRSLKKSESGNVAIIFAMVAFILALAAGGAVDYSRAALARRQMQDALDAAALALSKQATTLTTSAFQTQADALFKVNFKNREVSDLELDPDYLPKKSEVTITGRASLKTAFLGLAGMNEIPLTASSTVTWGGTRLRVALVLDNTGSMSDDGKMSALKTATHNLLEQLQAAATEDGDVYVSIVPFSKDVNVGADNDREDWISWTDWEAKNGRNVQTCSGRGRNKHCTTIWEPDDHDRWNGCITDRNQNYDITNDPPSTASGARFPAEQYSYCPSQLIALTYDWDKLGDRVDAMRPNGNTNQSIGLQWGWQSLTEEPFDIPAMDGDRKYQQVIILLTDGLNTENRWTTRQSTIDARQEKACDNIRDEDITLYTVQVNTGHDATSQLLKECASDKSKFFLLTSADQIVTAFDTIGTELSQLRISE